MGPLASKTSRVGQAWHAAETLREEPIGFFFEHEGASGGDIATERGRADWKLHGLPSDGSRIAVVDAETNGELGRTAGASFDPTIVVTQSRDFANDELSAKSRLHDDAGGIEGFDELHARAIETGHFGLIDPDFAIVDLHSGQGGENVFDHFDAGALP